MTKQETLARMDFGQRIAEEEGNALAQYFVETDNWKRLVAGEIDIIYGPKGSGKSALYALLVDRTNDLFDKKVLLVPGENPRGTPAFRDLATDPPATEREFIGLWKLYFLSLLSESFEEYGIRGESAIKLRRALEHEGLIRGSRSLASVLTAAFDYVKRFFRPGSVEGSVQVDPATQLPTGFTGKISFSEPTAVARSMGIESIGDLFTFANQALFENDDYSVWILLDRLDVAFAESPELEQNALRALFRVYLDLTGYSNIQCKIFLRTDIWNRITGEGFREGSHITRHVIISWSRASLLNLIIRRAIHNIALVEYYGTDREAVLESVEAQQELYFRMCPDQVDVGPNKPSSLDWMLSRTRDGTQSNAPRELIHFLNSLRAQQMYRYEIGEEKLDGELLFSRAAFKGALPEVSKVRLTQTLYAEYPDLKASVERLRGEKTLHRVGSLARIWEVPEAEARRLADSLTEIGFFERRGTREAPEYWIPFLYRDALELVQGTAD